MSQYWCLTAGLIVTKGLGGQSNRFSRSISSAISEGEFSVEIISCLENGVDGGRKTLGCFLGMLAFGC